MSDKLITLAKILCVIVGISFSLMLVAICFSTAWRVLTLSWLVGCEPPRESWRLNSLRKR
ncbi:hypothetical protein ELJ81_004716 [Escherichia coli]|nr:hypothetical protein [Escherichia coli]